MTAIQPPFPREWSVDDLLRHLGVPANRIRLAPPPGTAVEEDVLRVREQEGRLCELIDGVLVEKTMGFHESTLAGYILYLLHDFFHGQPPGKLTAPDGTMRLMPGQVRIPDVAFISRERIERCANFAQPIPDLTPDLAIEVVSENNTPQEIERKVKEYFFAGTVLVWVVDPRTWTVDVYTAPDQRETIGETGELKGEPVIPGLCLPVARIFAQAPRPEVPEPPRRKRKS